MKTMHELTRCVEAPDHFILRIVWDSVDGHMKGFRPSAPFKTFLSAVRPFVDRIQEMRHYEPTAIRWSR